MKTNIAAFLILILSIPILSFNTYGQTKNGIVIGSIIPLSGPAAKEALSVQRGMQIALEEVNEAGGVLGKPLNILWRDSGLNPEVGASFAKTLIDVDRVPLILSALSSAVTLATGVYSNNQKIVEIAIGSVFPELRRIGPYFFSVTCLADTMGTALAKFAFEDSKAKTAGFLSVDYPIARAVKEAIEMSSKQADVEIVSNVSFSIHQKEFHSEIRDLLKPQPQIVFLIASAQETMAILKQAYEIGFKEKLGWYSPYIEALSKYLIPETAEGFKGLDYGVEEPVYKEFTKKCEKRFGEPPTTVLSAYAYDAIKMVALAINKADSTNPDKLKTALFEIAKTYKGVTNDKTFDEDGMPKSPMYSGFIFRKGKLVSYSPTARPWTPNSMNSGNLSGVPIGPSIKNSSTRATPAPIPNRGTSPK